MNGNIGCEKKISETCIIVLLHRYIITSDGGLFTSLFYMLLHSSDTCVKAIFNSDSQYLLKELLWELHITFLSTLDPVFLYFLVFWCTHANISLFPLRLDIDRAIKTSEIAHVWGVSDKDMFF